MSVSKQWMPVDPHDPNMAAAYVEGRLDPREEAIVAAHAAECADCREVIAALTRAAGPALPGVAGPEASSASASWWRARYALPVAAALAVATIGAVLALRLSNPAVPPADPQPTAVSPAPASPTPAPVPVPVPPGAAGRPAPAPRAADPVDERLLPRRGAEQTVGGKVFRLVAGEWIDEAYDPLAALPLVEVRTPAERRALLDRVPALRPYPALGADVTVVFDGTVYRFRPTARRTP